MGNDTDFEKIGEIISGMAVALENQVTTMGKILMACESKHDMTAHIIKFLEEHPSAYRKVYIRKKENLANYIVKRCAETGERPYRLTLKLRKHLIGE